MLVLGLDLSTNTGWALKKGTDLLGYGLISSPTFKHSLQDLNFYAKAEYQAENIGALILDHHPDLIVIEQTNLGKSRDSQKLLEMCHCLFLQMCQWLGVQEKIVYCDTSAWRSALGITLSKEQRAHNKLVKQGKARGKITSKHLCVDYVNKKFNLNFKLKDNNEADAIALALMEPFLKVKIDTTPFKDSELEAVFA